MGGLDLLNLAIGSEVQFVDANLSVEAMRSERVSRVRAKLSMLLSTIMAVILRSWTFRFRCIKALVPKVRMMEIVVPKMVRNKLPQNILLPFSVWFLVDSTSSTVWVRGGSIFSIKTIIC